MKNKEKDDHEPEIQIKIETKHGSDKFNSYDEFLSQDIPKELEEISLHLIKYLDYDHCIMIDLRFQTWATPKISVSGKDQVWVSGIIQELNKIFAERSTNHRLMHKKETAFPIVMVFAMLTGFAVSLALSSSDEVGIWNKFITGSFSLGFVFAGFGAMGPYWMFLEWLFPIVEFEDIGLQQKIRKNSIKIITGVIFAFIAALLISLLPR